VGTLITGTISATADALVTSHFDTTVRRIHGHPTSNDGVGITMDAATTKHKIIAEAWRKSYHAPPIMGHNEKELEATTRILAAPREGTHPC